MDSLSSMKDNFYLKLDAILQNKSANSVYISQQKYTATINNVKQAQSKQSGKTPSEYQLLKRFDILNVGKCEKLIFPLKNNSNIRYYVAKEDLFDVIHSAHLAIGHGGRNRTQKELERNYKNVTIESVMIYLRLCDICRNKQNVSKRKSAVKLTISDETNSRCHVDLIDMQSNPDGDYKYVLVYQDYLTKFVQLRPLKTEGAKEVAVLLLDIFSTFGAPSILQSDNGREFASRVVEKICSMWDELKIVHGTSSHIQTQNSAEHVKQDIESTLSAWLEANNTQKWYESLPFVQVMCNRTYHKGIKSTPYEAMFGTPMKIGLKSSTLPIEAIEKIKTEEDLEVIIRNLNSTSDNINYSGKTQEDTEIYTISDEEIEERDQMTSSKRDDLIIQKCKSEIKKQTIDRKRKSEKAFLDGNAADTFKPQIPDEDQDKGDLHNILTVILNEDGVDSYESETKYGILNQLQARNQSSLCEERSPALEEVSDESPCLRKISKKSATLEGQSYKKCFCKGSCMSKKCSCKSLNKFCSSKCCNSTTCLNK